MTVYGEAATDRGFRPLVTLIVVLVAGVAIWFAADRWFYFAHFDPETYGDFWPRRMGLLPHIFGGTVALLSGIVQLWLGLTGRVGRLHHVLGRCYVGGVLIGAAGGFYLAITTTGLAYGGGLFLLDVAWLVTTSMAVLAISRRAIGQHREWMIRSYVVTFAFVSFRTIVPVAITWKVAPITEIQGFAAFACWSVPLLFTEALLQIPKLARGVNAGR